MKQAVSGPAEIRRSRLWPALFVEQELCSYGTPEKLVYCKRGSGQARRGVHKSPRADLGRNLILHLQLLFLNYYPTRYQTAQDNVEVVQLHSEDRIVGQICKKFASGLNLKSSREKSIEVLRISQKGNCTVTLNTVPVKSLDTFSQYVSKLLTGTVHCM